MVVGDKIKLVKPIGLLTEVGEEYTVSRVTRNGFVFESKTTTGYMTLDDFKDHFELVTAVGNEKPISPWSEWTSDTVWTLDYPYRKKLYVEKRNNGQRIQLRVLYKDKYVTASASCSPVDEFDEDKGIMLARTRLLSRLYKKVANEIKESL